MITIHAACAQKTASADISKVHVFAETRHMGNVPVDENGNQGRGYYIVYKVYLEIKGDHIPEWTAAVKSGKTLPLSNTETLSGAAILIGKNAATGEAVNITPAKGNHFYKLEFVNNQVADNDDPTDSITLKGKYKGANISYPVTTITPLETMPVP